METLNCCELGKVEGPTWICFSLLTFSVTVGMRGLHRILDQVWRDSCDQDYIVNVCILSLLLRSLVSGFSPAHQLYVVQPLFKWFEEVVFFFLNRKINVDQFIYFHNTVHQHYFAIVTGVLLVSFFNVFLYFAGFCRTQAYNDQRLICCRIDTDLSDKTVESQFIFFSAYEGLLHCRHLVFRALKAADP